MGSRLVLYSVLLFTVKLCVIFFLTLLGWIFIRLMPFLLLSCFLFIISMSFWTFMSVYVAWPLTMLWLCLLYMSCDPYNFLFRFTHIFFLKIFDILIFGLCVIFVVVMFWGSKRSIISINRFMTSTCISRLLLTTFNL